MILGIDIGGANTKISSDDGSQIELHYVPLWKDTTLPDVLRDVVDRHQPEAVGVVMTGELADCFKSKDEGALFIRDIVLDAFPDALFLDRNGFLGRAESPRDLSAANWVASARLVGENLGDGLFVDVGSTTSDIIPIKENMPVAAKSDFERLKRSELVYQGVLRTNLAALMDSVEIHGEQCRISSELFSTTADAYLLLDKITRDQYTCETADGADKDHLDAMRRIARLVCADLSEVSAVDVFVIARQVMDQQVNVLANAIKEVAEREDLDKVYAAGIGEFLVEEAATKLGFPCTRLSEVFGKEISKVFPAYAVAQLVKMSKKNDLADTAEEPPEEDSVKKEDSLEEGSVADDLPEEENYKEIE